MPSESSDRTSRPSAAPIVLGDGAGLRSAATGSAWMIGARWAMRSIGLVSTIILARLFTPEDFGLVAIGAITVQFVLVFADAGQDFAVIRNADATSEHFDTAWTMSVCAGVTVALILIAIAPLAGWFFHEPRAVPVIQVLALKPLIGGFTNVGILNFRKNLQFEKEFLFLVAQKITVFAIVVTLALIFQSYWALVVGNVFGEVLNVWLSYYLHPHRPKLRITKLREIWTYSVWIQFAQIGSFIGDKADQILVGGLAGTTAIGAYNVSEDLASAPINEVVVPIARAVFPVYSRLLKQPTDLAETYMGVLSTVAIFSLASGVGVALVAHDLVAVFLGAKWLSVTPLVVVLGIGSSVFGIARSANMILSVTGNGRLFALRHWLYVGLLIPAAIVGGLGWGTIGVATARMAAIIVFVPAVFFAVAQVIPISARQIFERLWRPVTGSLCMVVIVKLSGTDEIAVVPLRLFANVALGAATYSLALLFLWRLAGRPNGPERIAIAQAVRVGQRLRRHFSYND